MPEVDNLFSTNPEPSKVRMSEMAKRNLKAARAAMGQAPQES
jgi:hypothetical protein